MLTVQTPYAVKYRDLAQKSSQKYGIPIQIILAQAILESAEGKSALARKQNNHFGIKYGKRYATFASVADCYEAHGRIFQASRYKPCRDCRNDVKCWAVNLQNCGYATSAEYTKTILSIIQENKL